MGEWGYTHSKAHISMPEDKRQPSWPTERDQAVELKEVAVSQTHSYPHKLTALAGTQKATEEHRAGTQNTNIYLNRCPTGLADAAAVIQQPFERPFTRAKRWKQEPLRQGMQLVACSKKCFPNYFFLFHLRQETRTSFSDCCSGGFQIWIRTTATKCEAVLASSFTLTLYRMVSWTLMQLAKAGWCESYKTFPEDS